MKRLGWVWLLGCASCFAKPTVGYDKEEIEKRGAELFEQATGVKPAAFTCPGDDRVMGELTCTVRSNLQDYPVKVTVTPGDDGIFGPGDIHVQTMDLVVGKSVEPRAKELAGSMGIALDAVTCPALTRAREQPGQIECSGTAKGKPLKVLVDVQGERITGIDLPDVLNGARVAEELTRWANTQGAAGAVVCPHKAYLPTPGNSFRCPIGDQDVVVTVKEGARFDVRLEARGSGAD